MNMKSRDLLKFSHEVRQWLRIAGKIAKAVKKR
jgi:hypothetical protein